MRSVLQKLARQLVLVPLVAVASYFLMAMLPLTTESEAKRQVSPELAASYRRDLGIGEPLGFLRPWQKLWRGERLGTSAQGVTGDELARKLSGSVGVGLLALPLALTWALGFAMVRTRWRRGRWAALGDVVPALAFGTPVFIPALLLAPAVVERGNMLPELCAALVTSIWPGIFLGTLVGDSLETELSRDYVRTALGKGLAPGTVLRRHVLPNVLPALLDAVGPVATALLAGSFAAERVLGLPYFGQLYVLAVLNKQVAVVVVATTTFASLLVVVSLAVELTRYAVDPRSREARA
ncbi:ABC transporter permease subunit [Myxococcus sp. CA051A]|uniref:ABC transporter permease subunit n=1 Tax=Myxococcus llanfairpwllgwyngyllgogerychwyrndrobwllllantysiliogogogochensis TaxID=2590453 RepID=A0A540X3S9_9BACT|nr:MULTISPECIES: ABC transporter permease subunit [Myxococcus]NTX07121.1 ABC transporter permease subunit [Myxococcus sp. CA040A]NTX17455.1 ABC transporter permease subunit [Myxococcus sp. CA056]NTX39034.1 ABC transporter permease subunit [Myxococcus sp. CA033]NTX66551.1 ABC transporter permease subunit [Myxococcus sp. CA051A]TQF15918.1 ABC transporter permease subunit [Myxococcus llanfairpwllgwyngyllgogerychwyrndrobwllllantysiliogogogochensis]